MSDINKLIEISEALADIGIKRSVNHLKEQINSMFNLEYGLMLDDNPFSILKISDPSVVQVTVQETTWEFTKPITWQI